MAPRHLGHEVRGSRRDDDEIRVPGEPDMPDIGLVLPVEQVRVAALARTSPRPRAA